MDRSERFYKIQGMLQHRGTVRLQQFLDELEVSKATFKRDLEYLRDRMRAPIVYDRHEEAYRFDMGVADKELWQLPGLWFTAEEMQALLTMDKLLADLQPGVLSEAIAPLRKRLRELLGSRQHSAEDVARRIRILAIGSRRVEPAHFRALSTALLSRRRLRIRHQRRQDGEVLEREVSPQRLVHYRDNWYLDAWCHKRQALRTFGVDAIESATVSEKEARNVPEETLDRQLASGYGIFAGSETQEAVLLFGQERARWVSREVWHPKQDGKLQLDGSYLLRFPYAQEPELVMDILRYGPDVQVLAPDSLREAVATKLRAAAALY
ncbi:MAG TPA: WYL domain-containing protein [Steroidobacteraceae bacterium]|nr:WYL domain-containing protein [Steroidobacteraceae bacterium]